MKSPIFKICETGSIFLATLLLISLSASAVTTNVTTVAELLGAIDAVASGSTIVLAAGIYDLSDVEPKSRDGNGPASILIDSKELTFKGADATSWREIEGSTNRVVIKGSSSARIVYGYAGSGRRSKFNNITFDGGNAGEKDGGAIYFLGPTTSGCASNCVFRNCRAANGGATYCVTALDCLYEDNEATAFGGAAYAKPTTSGTIVYTDFDACDFRCNAAASGGAVYGTSLGCVVGCSFLTNSVSGNGGAIYVAEAAEDKTDVSGCTFSGNVSTNSGGAVFTANAAVGKFTVTDSRFCGNISRTQNGGAAWQTALSRCTFTGNAAEAIRGGAVANCNVSDSGFTNNICGASSRGGAGNLSNFVRCTFSGTGDISGGSADHCIFDGVVGNYVFDSVRSNGGAVYATNCLVANCSVSRIVNNAGQTGEFVNCTFADNAVSAYMVYCKDQTSAGVSYPGTNVFSNCLFAGNVYSKSGSESPIDLRLYKAEAATDFGYSSIAFDNCLYKTGLELYDSAGLEDYETHAAEYDLLKSGLVMSDPRFAAGDARFPALPYYSLLYSSPARNGGANAPWMSGATDLGGNVRIFDDVVDVGCYECLLPPTGLIIFVH